jgi:outer membrane protein OmpA-like peptidoglycan-associated protein
MPFLPVYTSLHKAWEKGKKPKNAIILYKVTPITEGDIKALGLAGVNSTAHAGSEPGKSVSSGAFGSGWGSAKSWVWDSCYYLVIFFNKSGDNLTASSPKAKKQASKVIKNTREIKTQNVYFDFDSSEIDSEKQIKTIEYNTQILKDILPKLSQNQKIYIVGCTSDEGSNEYNIILGENRAYEVAKAYAENLQKYFNPNFVLDKIKFVSMGELFPQYKKLKNNRRTYIIIAEEL